MAASVQVFSPAEFKVYINPETTVGTANKTAMEQLNVNDIVSVSTDVLQTLDVRSGSTGRVLHTADILTRDEMSLSTITIPMVFDTDNLDVLLEAVTGVAVATNDIVVGEDYTFTGLATAAVTSGNTGTFTVCIDSPVSNEAKYFTGCLLQELTLTMDSGTNGGRMEGSVTFVTKFRPADGAASPTTPNGYGSTWYFMCNYTTKQIGVNGTTADDVVVNKIELSFSNPSLFVGCASGNPEVVTRGIPKITVTGSFGVKYDSATADLWEERRDGDDIIVTFSGSSPVFDFTGSHARLTGDLNPAGGDDGVFMELPLEFATDGTDDVITLSFA